MIVVRAVLAIAAALSFEAAAGRFLPGLSGWVDPMMVPVVWFSVVGSQRQGMLVGCAAGLCHDAWFEVGVFGLSGFKKTLVGYGLAAVSARVDFNREGGLVLAGALGSLADSLLDALLRELMDRRDPGLGVVEALSRAVTTAVLLWIVAGVVTRVRGERSLRRM